MELFPPSPQENRLPCDGEVHYHGPILSAAEADGYRDLLLETIPWEPDQVWIFGKHYVTARKIAWFGDREFSYQYSGHTRRARAWTNALLELKSRIESLAGRRFNACLLNLYHNGDEGMGWHSDDESSLVPAHAIASLSLGAERPFLFKHKNLDYRVKLILEHGGLLIMKGSTQRHWLHSVPKNRRVLEPRVSLTFRRMRD